MKPVSIKKLVSVAVSALKDIKAQNITVLDVRELTPLYDSLIIASAQSARQTKALANLVREKIKEAGGAIVGVEGEEAGEWVLVDCGDIVVHIMQPAVRDYYNLEALWTPPTPIRKSAEASSEKPAKAAKKSAKKVAKKTVTKTITRVSLKVTKKTAKKSSAKTAKTSAVKRAKKTLSL